MVEPDTDDAPKHKTLRWPQGPVTMQPRGAMLRDLAVRSEYGQILRPSHRALWVGTPDAAQLSGLM